MRLTSTPSGIAFDPAHGDCAVTEAGSNVATCTTAAAPRVATAGRSVSARAAVTSFTGFLALTIPETQPNTDLGVDVDVPEGYADPSTSNNHGDFHYQPVDVALSGVSPSSHPDGDGTYTVRGEVTGVSTLPNVSYFLDGQATFATPLPDGCTGSETALSCPPPSDNNVVWRLKSTEPTSPQRVSITARAPDAFVDRHQENNTASTTLTPQVDVAMDPFTPAKPHPDEDGNYTVTSEVTGVDTLPSVTYNLTGGATFTTPVPAGCERTDGTLQCKNPADGPVTFTLRPDQRDEATSVTITATLPNDDFTDTKPGNNSASTTLPGQVDVGMDHFTPPAPHPDDDGNYTVTSKVTGVDTLPSVTYTLTGDATFTTPVPTGCARTDGTLDCENPADGPVTFTLRSKHPDRATRVTITATLPNDDFTDTNPKNNSKSATLTPKPAVDVVLESLNVQSTSGATSTLRAAVSGVPKTSDVVLFNLSGPQTGKGGIHFVGGEDRASGKGEVGCKVTSPTRVTCSDATPSFSADMKVVRPNSVPSQAVTITVEAVGSEEDGPSENNSRDVTIP